MLVLFRCRSKSIETWDIRNLSTCPTHDREPPPAVSTPSPPAPPRLDDLTCAANSLDFWVEPHGLCVAVHGAPRHSQRFGAKHVFWPWPEPGRCSRPAWSASSSSNAGEDGTELGIGGGLRKVSVRGKGRGGGGGGAGGAGGGGRGSGVRGVEVLVPGVVSDSDYRLCLSTDIKFTDTHLATVLDSSRVLVDEMMAGGGPAGGVEGVVTVLLSS